MELAATGGGVRGGGGEGELLDNVPSSSSEMKKSSYYVLFLGAKESRGLRGPHYIEPVLQYFVSQESRMQALKVTLQVGSRGLKIIPVHHRTTTGDNSQTDKHFIPHHAITCVFQAAPPNDDIVSCILLIYNPDTRCPVHVHCYRCDSPETATVLKSQLETLVNREDNQLKFRDIESRLQSKGLLPCSSPTKRDRGTPEFDCRTSDSSENSDRGFSSGSGVSNVPSERIATLYDSLAAELREKLNTRNKNTPILFPPRDYDTMHRQRGNLIGIDARRCSNPAVVGSGAIQRNRRSYASREQDSCGRSSGIGSAEDNCSPIHDNLVDSHVVPSSSDDEEWNPSSLVATQSTQFLVRPTFIFLTPPGVSATPAEGNGVSKSPLPPPLPKRPEMRQRSPPDLSASPPPLPMFSREKFEGVRQKWEKLDHQYVKQRSHDSLDDGYRSREAAEADYRRQLSRESLLRSLSRSKTGSRDSLDRWVEAGVRSRNGMWRKLESEDTTHLQPDSLGCHPSINPNGIGLGHLHRVPSPNNTRMGPVRKLHSSQTAIIPESNCQLRSPMKGGGGSYGIPGRLTDPRRPKEKSYRELDEQERFPGLDKDTARLVLHSSNLNLSQHIYSEPSFENCGPKHFTQPQKSKKFSFAFWK